MKAIYLIYKQYNKTEDKRCNYNIVVEFFGNKDDAERFCSNKTKLDGAEYYYRIVYGL